MDPGDPEYWRARWREGETGWHRAEVNPHLLRHAEQLTGGRPGRILVPMCGRSLDLAWLASQGHEVIGVEVDEPAVRGLFADAGLEPDERDEPPYRRLEAGSITCLVGDFFALTPSHTGVLDAVWDRGALIALPPRLRAAYVETLLSVLPAGARVLLSAVAYDGTEALGPPFSLPEHAVRALFEPHAELEILFRDPAGGVPPHFAEAGVTHTEDTVYRIERR